MFPLLAAANGIDLSSIKWIDVTPQLRETLLAQGQTDATIALITDLAVYRADFLPPRSELMIKR